MKPALQQVWKPYKLITSAAATALVLMFVAAAHAQDAQFLFDANGNLTAQTTESNSPPLILTQPQSEVVPPGALASFIVVAANTHNLTYQWRFNGTDINGATGDALLLQNVSALDQGQYSVVLANSSGSVTSAPAALLLDGDRDGLPDSWEQTYFGGLGQKPTGDFDGDGISNLDEYLDGTNPADSSSVRYRLTVLSNGGLVTVVPSKSGYTNGEIVTLTATPFAPDIFHGWTGDTNTSSSTIALVMNDNKTVVAHLGSENLVWTNTVSGNWHVAANWSPNFVPGPNDDVTINLSITASINASADCRSLILGSGGNPTISGTGTLTLHGDSIWYNGSMTGTGRTIVATGGVLNLMPVSSAFLTTRTLDNAGTVLWTGSVNLTFNNAVLTNRPGALFHNQGGGDFINAVSSVARFDNAGTFRKSTDTATMSVVSGIAFNNYNTVEIQAGGLLLSGGGINQGTMDFAPVTSLNLNNGIFTASSLSSIAGAANLIVSGGTANLAGLVNLTGNHTFSSGTANLTGNYFCTNNLLTVNGGTANCNGTGLILPTTLNLSAGTLGGTNFISFGSTMNWTGGSFSGNARALIPVGGTLNLIPSGSAAYLVTRTLENAGTILMSGTGNFIFTSSVLTNRPGALVHNLGAGDFNATVSSVSRFDNAGTFRKSADTGTMSVVTGVAFNNYNAVEIQAGGLLLTGGGLNQGTMDFAPATSLNLNNGTFNANGASSITGAANLIVSGGTANLAGLCSLSGNHTFSSGTANLTGAYYCTNNLLTVNGGTANCNGSGLILPTTINLSVGTLGGTNFISFGSTMNWTGGSFSGNARALIPVGGTLNLIPSGSAAYLVTRTLENAGTILMSGTGNFIFTSSVLTNRPGALVHNLGAGDFSATVSSVSRFDNAGTFRKSADTGTMSVVTGVAFNNYNAVEIQAGILAPSGGYTSTTNSFFSCAIGGTTVGTGYGRLQVSGTVTLNGALNVILANGFIPAVNDSFTVLTASTRNGTFANFYFPSNVVTMQMSNTTTSVIVRVTDVLVVPQPTLLQPELLGPDIRLTWTSVSNRTYRLEFNPDLNPANWIAVPGDVIGLSNTASKLDTLISSNRFYRVRVIP